MKKALSLVLVLLVVFTACVFGGCSASGDYTVLIMCLFPKSPNSTWEVISFAPDTDEVWVSYITNGITTHTFTAYIQGDDKGFTPAFDQQLEGTYTPEAGKTFVVNPSGTTQKPCFELREGGRYKLTFTVRDAENGSKPRTVTLNVRLV